MLLTQREQRFSVETLDDAGRMNASKIDLRVEAGLRGCESSAATGAQEED